MLKNCPGAALFSPGKITSLVVGQYKHTVDRLRDDLILCDLNIPLPKINAKSSDVVLGCPLGPNFSPWYCP